MAVPMNAERSITELLKTYEKSLNTSDAALAACCYASDQGRNDPIL